jgi:hypothetical protein
LHTYFAIDFENGELTKGQLGLHLGKLIEPDPDIIERYSANEKGKARSLRAALEIKVCDLERRRHLGGQLMVQ